MGTKVLRIGELRVGVCRHRALLYKYCADRTGQGLSDIRSPRHRMPLISRNEGSNALNDVASNIYRALTQG